MSPTGDPMVTRVEVHGIPNGHPSARRAVARLTESFDALGVHPTTAELRFTDENGPKGGQGVRCAMTVKLPRRPQVHVAELATTPRLAFDAAIAKLERSLARLRQLERDKARHPKKYFAASREWRAS